MRPSAVLVRLAVVRVRLAVMRMRVAVMRMRVAFMRMRVAIAAVPCTLCECMRPSSVVWAVPRGRLRTSASAATQATASPEPSAIHG